jgi:hypothetical protein
LNRHPRHECLRKEKSPSSPSLATNKKCVEIGQRSGIENVAKAQQAHSDGQSRQLK